MKTFDFFARFPGVKSAVRLGMRAAVSASLLAACLGLAARASAQVEVSGWQGGFSLSAGAMASGYYVGYGDRKMIGPDLFVDAETRRHLGVEAEARRVLYPMTAGVKETVWTGGPRWSFFPIKGKFYPYVKGMVGVGQFDFPYGYAKGSYLVIAPGGGMDYALNHRIRIRLVDVSYQYWNQFTFGSMPSYGVSAGIRVRVF
jgi:hypothetical protein